jgi:GR25 family glycosyltransferase involved in LPS biosynthesis
MQSSRYNFFDDIVCINLEHREDRKRISQNIFKKLNINCRFHTVKKHPKGGMYGCFDSHIQVIQDAYNKGLNNILIFEDDIKLTPSYTTSQFDICTEFMKYNKEWDIFFFGYIPCNTNRGSIKDLLNAEFVNGHIIKYRPFATHSYCVSRKGMQKILNNYKLDIGRIHVDQFYVNMKLESYCTVPMLFDQHFCLDNDNEPFDSFEAFIRRFQCQAEMYNLLYRPTLLKYKLHKHRNICILNIMIALMFIGVTIYIVKIKTK